MLLLGRLGVAKFRVVQNPRRGGSGEPDAHGLVIERPPPYGPSNRPLDEVLVLKFWRRETSRGDVYLSARFGVTKLVVGESARRGDPGVGDFVAVLFPRSANEVANDRELERTGT